MNRYSIMNPMFRVLPWNRIGAGEDLGRLFAGLAEQSRSPALDLYEEKDAFVLHCELPGIGREHIAVSFQEGILSVSGELKPPQGAVPLFRAERQFGKFERRISIPGAVEPSRILASYAEGVLKVVLPKAESSKPRQIPISFPESSGADTSPQPDQAPN